MHVLSDLLFECAQPKVVRNLRTVLALPFSPLASGGLQRRQVAEIALRCHRYQDTCFCDGTSESILDEVDV